MSIFLGSSFIILPPREATCSTKYSHRFLAGFSSQCGGNFLHLNSAAFRTHEQDLLGGTPHALKHFGQFLQEASQEHLVVAGGQALTSHLLSQPSPPQAWSLPENNVVWLCLPIPLVLQFDRKSSFLYIYILLLGTEEKTQ